MGTREIRREQEDHYALCAKAARLGVPVSLDDPDSPETVSELRDAVRAAEIKTGDRVTYSGDLVGTVTAIDHRDGQPPIAAIVWDDGTTGRLYTYTLDRR